MPKLVIDQSEFYKGWAKDLGGSNSTGVEAPRGYYSKSSTGISPFRLSKFGQIAPGEPVAAIADGGGIITGLGIAAATTSNGKSHVITDDEKIFSIDHVTADALADEVAISTPHASHNGTRSDEGDIISCFANVSSALTEIVLYSWNDNGNSGTGPDGDIGRMLKDGTSEDDNFMSDVPTGKAVLQNGGTSNPYPHKMVIGPDKNVYITNGQYLAQYDPFTGADGTFNATKLNFGKNFIGTSIDVYGNYVVVVGYYATTYITSLSRSESVAWLWDTNGEFPQQSYSLFDNYATAVKNTEYGLYVFTQGRNNTTKIKLFTGSGFKTIFESQQIGNTPLHNSVEIWQNMLHFTNASRLMCMDGEAFHLRNLGGSTGFLKNLTGNTLYLASGTDIYTVSTTEYLVDCDFRSRVFSLPHKSLINKITVYFSQFGTGASLTFSLFKNYANVGIGGADDLTNETITNATHGAISSYVFYPTGIIDVDSFYFNLRFNHAATTNTAAIVRKVEIEFEEVERD